MQNVNNGRLMGVQLVSRGGDDELLESNADTLFLVRVGVVEVGLQSREKLLQGVRDSSDEFSEGGGGDFSLLVVPRSQPGNHLVGELGKNLLDSSRGVGHQRFPDFDRRKSHLSRGICSTNKQVGQNSVSSLLSQQREQGLACVDIIRLIKLVLGETSELEE